MLMLMAEHGHGWWFVWPIFWLAVIVGIVWLLRHRWRPDREPPAQAGP